MSKKSPVKKPKAQAPKPEEPQPEATATPAPTLESLFEELQSLNPLSPAGLLAVLESPVRLL